MCVCVAHCDGTFAIISGCTQTGFDVDSSFSFFHDQLVSFVALSVGMHKFVASLHSVHTAYSIFLLVCLLSFPSMIFPVVSS